MNKEYSDLDVNAIKDIKESLESTLTQLPKPLQMLLKPHIKKSLNGLSKNIRSPRIALYGRAGAGKSSLINAILGERKTMVGAACSTTLTHESYVYNVNGWKIDFVDSRGIGDSDDNESFQLGIDYIVSERVDVLLFVIPANERSWVDNDARFLDELKKAHKTKFKKDLSVILVINKLDLVSPTSEWNPPYKFNAETYSSLITPKNSREAKIKNIIEAIKARTESFKSISTTYIPVCSEWSDFDDRRYNIDELSLLIFDLIPDDAKPGFAGISTVIDVKKKVARKLIWSTALTTGSTCFIPIPGVEIGALIIFQISLVSLIARIGSTNKDQDHIAINFIKNMGVYGAGLGISAFMQQGLKLLPGIGSVASGIAAVTVATITVSIGEAAIRHFIEGASIEESKIVYEKQNKILKKKFIRTRKKEGPSKSANELDLMEEEYMALN